MRFDHWIIPDAERRQISQRGLLGTVTHAGTQGDRLPEKLQPFFLHAAKSKPFEQQRGENVSFTPNKQNFGGSFSNQLGSVRESVALKMGKDPCGTLNTDVLTTLQSGCIGTEGLKVQKAEYKKTQTTCASASP